MENTKSHAEQYQQEFPMSEVEPVKREWSGRQVFADGSWIEMNVVGEISTGRYSIEEWIGWEREARSLGNSDRLNRRPMSRCYYGPERRFTERICKAYRDGFFDAPSWPSRT